MNVTRVGLTIALGALALAMRAPISQAGTMTFSSSLTATTPTTINEGESVSVLAKYALSHTGTSSGNTGHFYYNFVKFHSGDGQDLRDWANGRDYSGQQTWSGLSTAVVVPAEVLHLEAQPSGWPGNTNASPGRNQSFDATFGYADDGSFTLNAHGDSAVAAFFGLPATSALWFSTGGTPSSGIQSPLFNQNLNITVLNVAPTITSAPGNSNQSPGVSFNLSADATDPGLLDLFTFDWDLDGDGLYDNFSQSPGAGGSQSSAATATLSAGTYTLGVRVSDGDGGVATHSFDVTVVPEPSSLLLGSLATLGLAAWRWKRRSQ